MGDVKATTEMEQGQTLPFEFNGNAKEYLVKRISFFEIERELEAQIQKALKYDLKILKC